MFSFDLRCDVELERRGFEVRAAIERTATDESARRGFCCAGPEGHHRPGRPAGAAGARARRRVLGGPLACDQRDGDVHQQGPRARGAAAPAAAHARAAGAQPPNGPGGGGRVHSAAQGAALPPEGHIASVKNSQLPSQAYVERARRSGRTTRLCAPPELLFARRACR